MKDIKNINDLKLDDIIDFCKETDGAVEWLKKAANEPYTVKKTGKQVPKPFLALRNEFCEKYMPHLVSNKKKKKSMLDKINAL